MSTDSTSPPAGLRTFGPIIMRIAVLLTSAALGAFAHWLGVSSPAPAEKQSQAPPPEAAEYAPTFGWHADAEAIAANLDPRRTLHFDATPAGRAALGDGDAFLWRHVRKAAGREAPWYPNVNQQNVGCCVGCGWKHCADVCQATAIVAGQSFDFRPVSAEVIYGGSRVEVGNGRLSGDGSVGAWAKEYVSARGGVAAMQRYASADLSTFSPARARDFGRRGVPPDIAASAREHPVKSCALVKGWADAKRAVLQGYPVAVCSDQGFRMERDSAGRCRPQGRWNHCMALIGARGAPDEGGFLLNSWGDAAHTGPVWPPDMPAAGFWADAAVLDRMLRQGDSFALADVAGFPPRKLDWFVQENRGLTPPARLCSLFTLTTRPEVTLSW
jgi:hypothetical protein